MNKLLELIERIEGLVDWHADQDADFDDPSPVDMQAHCNGLVLKTCKEAREIIEADVERAKFGSEDLIADSINAFQYNQNETNDVRAFELGFNEGAAWVVRRMMKGEE